MLDVGTNQRDAAFRINIKASRRDNAFKGRKIILNDIIGRHAGYWIDDTAIYFLIDIAAPYRAVASLGEHREDEKIGYRYQPVQIFAGRRVEAVQRIVITGIPNHIVSDPQ